VAIFFPQPLLAFSDFLGQCDLSRPACSRCRRLGIMCEYLVPQQGQVFINRSVTNPFVKAVDVLSCAEKKKPPNKSAGPEQATPSRPRHEDSVVHSILKSPDPGPVQRAQLLSKFIEIYLPESTQGPGQTSASWVHALPDITVTNSAYDSSLAALCAAQLGIWNHDLALVKESHRLYCYALGELRKTINCRKLVAPEATLASIVMFSIYEVSLVTCKIRTKSYLSNCSSSQIYPSRILGG
jgi:hypothetical protein